MKQVLKSGYLQRKWKWRKMKSMTCSRYESSAIIVNNDGKDVLMVCGGQKSALYHGTSLESVEILDLNKSDEGWMSIASMNYKRSNSGICYDRIDGYPIWGHCRTKFRRYE